ncbi:MAG: lysophospholipid acyltransferase family protein [Gaiella sp.]
MTLYRVVRALFGPLVRAAWRVRTVGVERLPAGGCVLAPNHDSLSDPIFVGAAVPRPLRFLAKAELFRFPLRPVLAGLGAIPVRRGEGDRAAIAAAVAAAREGGALVIHPQGTVLGAVDRPWKRGAARVALEAGVPLVPVALVFTERALRPVRVRVGFPSVVVLVGEPIDVGSAVEPSEERAAELTEQVRLAVEALRAPFYAGRPER